MTLILTSEDVEKMLTMELCMEALEYAYAELGRDQAVMGPVIRVAAPLGESDGSARPLYVYAYSAMSGVLPGWDVAANRQISDRFASRGIGSGGRLVRTPASPGERWCGLVLLHRASTGELLAIMQDGFLQKTRVGGLAGIAAKYLARPDAEVLAVIGSGWQASAQVEAHCRVRRIREIRVFSPTPARREAFAREMASRVSAQITAVASPEAAVRGAHIVATATTSNEPVLRARWLEPGMFITSVRPFEFEPAVYDRCDQLVCNRRGPVWQHYTAGGAELFPEHGREIWDSWTRTEWEAVRLLGGVVAGRAPGRTSNDEIIAFMNQGEGLQFAAVGRQLYDLACERGLGIEVPLEWFHQDKKYVP